MKHYWYLLALPLLLAIGAVILLHRSKPQVPPITTKAVVQSPSQTLGETTELDNLVNQFREAQGLKDLLNAQSLDTAAQLKCNDMQSRQYWAHEINGEDFFKFNPVAMSYGENLARNYSSDQATVTAWEASPEHRANLTSPQFTTVGYAQCSGPMGNLTVQELELPL